MMLASPYKEYSNELFALKTSIHKKHCYICLHKSPLYYEKTCIKFLTWPIRCRFLNRKDPEVYLLLLNSYPPSTHKYIKKSVLEKKLFPVQFQYPELVRKVKKANKSISKRTTVGHIKGGRPK